jgi:SPP1 gp7 family putative phage head morphogenesis protein
VIRIDLPEIARRKGKPGAKLPPVGPTLACEVSLKKIMYDSIRSALLSLRRNPDLFLGIKKELTPDAATLSQEAKRVPKARVTRGITRGMIRGSGRRPLLVRGPEGEAWWSIASGLRTGVYRLAPKTVAKDSSPASLASMDSLFGFDLFMAQLRSALDSASSQAEGKVAAAYAAEERRHRTRLGKSIEKRYGLSMDDVFSSQDTAAQVRLAVQTSVSLIKGLNDEMAKKIEFTVLDAAQKGETTSVLVQRLRKEMGITRDRARLIASDQVASLNATLNKVRHEQIRVDRYVWETMLDDRVRPDHQDRQGRIYSWDDPPADGNPGEPINCRCVAAAYVG